MRRGTGWRSAFVAVALILVSSSSGCGSGDDQTFKPTRPTTTAVGGFGLTEDQRNFHLSFDIDRPGATIRVLDVQALTSPNVQYLGAVTVWPRDLPDANIGFGPKYPPPKAKAVHALEDEIPSTETRFVPEGFSEPPVVHVVTGFRLLRGEIGAVNGVRVTYEADGEKSTDTWTVAAIGCLRPKDCEGPAGSDDPDFENRVLTEAGLLPKD